MATHSSILAWRIPWAEELEGYSPWGCKDSGMTEQLTFSYLLIPLTCFAHHQTPSPSAATRLFSVSMSLFLSALVLVFRFYI